MPTTDHAKTPRDPHARERLRAAQQHETAAVARAWAAQDSVRRTHAKRDLALAKIDETVEDAELRLAGARADVVRVSGLERAALLLDAGPAELRRACARVQRNSSTCTR